jgi:hypothetical protein
VHLENLVPQVGLCNLVDLENLYILLVDYLVYLEHHHPQYYLVGLEIP